MLAERVKRNLAVLELLKAKGANKDDNVANLDLLKKYTGWGGLREAIFTPNIYKELKNHLTDSEINSFKQTIGSAYYTPELLIKFMWSSLISMGFSGLRQDGNRRNILEPSAGIGGFFNHMPAEIAKNSYIDAVELDNISCQLLSKIHPNITIINSSFESFYCNDQRYDLIIGNPPYGSNRAKDIFNPELSDLRIHHWFVAKSAKMLRKNGIIAMILPQFFLDNVKDHVRNIVNEAGVNLILAYRLPDDLFANAKVTVDIVFLQKAAKQFDWQNTRQKKIGEDSKAINEYYFNNPQHILGKLAIIPMYDRLGITCKSDGDLRKKLGEVYLKINRLANKI